MTQQEQIAQMAAVIYATGTKSIEEAVVVAEDIALAVRQRVAELDAWVNPPTYEATQDALMSDRRDDPEWNLDACARRLVVYGRQGRDYSDFAPREQPSLMGIAVIRDEEPF